MTERVDIVEKSVEDLEKEITCAICHDLYTEPKILPCLHYYCKQCIHRLTLRTGLDKPFSCPECRKDTTLPQGNVDELPTAFFVSRMKSVHSKLERAQGKVEAKCEMCSGDKAEGFCKQCALFVCEKCIESHRRMKVFAGHKIASLDELKEGAKEIIVEEPPLQVCKEHDEVMKIYCFDCNCLICRDCTIEDHSGHNHKFVKKSAPEMKEKLIKQLDPLKEVKIDMSRAVEEIKSTKCDIEAQGESMANDINGSFNELQKIIENYRKELLKEAALKVTEKLERLSGQEKSVSISSAVVQSVIEYTEQFVEHSSNDEIMCMHVEIKSHIEKEIKEHCKERKDLKPVEEVDIRVEVNCAKDLKQLLKSNARIIEVIDPTKCTVRGEGTKSTEVSKECGFSLIPKLTNGKRAKQECAVDCHLKSLVNGTIVKCLVDRREDNEYRISYTPTTRGRHELTVTVNGQKVAGSPFPVFVSIHPSKLGKPVKIIPGLNSPSGIALNSKGEMLVAEFNGMVVLDMDGTKLRSIKQSDHKFRGRLSSVAVDNEDNIYFDEWCGKNVCKFDKNMMKVMQKQTEHGYCSGVAVVGSEVMVSGQYNPKLEVYTTELNLVRKIREDKGYFNRVSSDGHGKLYVGATGHSRIQVLSKGGESLHSFGSDENGVNKLSEPRGVCVAGQNVYVSDWDKHKISIFTTEGEYVTSFGQCGANEGDLNHPWGICIDNDGFLYICDCNNNRIVIF